MLSKKAQTLLESFNQRLLQFSQSQYQEDLPLHSACRYALAGEGKRIRPLLTLLVNEACQGKADAAFPGAIAIEMVHTYSLIHDDLPCLDDDDLRRGRPTLHKAFDEATALLTGDALLTDAFAVLSQTPASEASATVAMIQTLSTAAGGSAMVLGQALDLHWTGRQGYTGEDLTRIHQLKTGCLIAAACKLGALAAGAKPATVEAFARFGTLVGLAFQINDDLLDDLQGTGKSQGKDLKQGKLTYLRLMNRAEAEALAAEVTNKATSLIETITPHTTEVAQFASSLINRRV